MSPHKSTFGGAVAVESGADAVTDVITVNDSTTSTTFVDTSLSITRNSAEGNLVIAIAVLTERHGGAAGIKVHTFKLVMDGADIYASMREAERNEEDVMVLIGTDAGDGANQVIKVQYKTSGETLYLVADDAEANISTRLMVIEIAGGAV